MAAAAQTWEQPEAMQCAWQHGDCLALSDPQCARCGGLGYRQRFGKPPQACGCVLRAVFRHCLNRWRTIQREPRFMSKVTLERGFGGQRGGFIYGRKREEFAADFEMTTRRVLAADPLALRIFELHHLGGLSWRETCAIVKIDRGNFYHLAYLIEKRVGRVLRELQPYALHPMELYFSGGLHEAAPGARARRVQ